MLIVDKNTIKYNPKKIKKKKKSKGQKCKNMQTNA